MCTFYIHKGCKVLKKFLIGIQNFQMKVEDFNFKLTYYRHIRVVEVGRRNMQNQIKINGVSCSYGDLHGTVATELFSVSVFCGQPQWTMSSYHAFWHKTRETQSDRGQRLTEGLIDDKSELATEWVLQVKIFPYYAHGGAFCLRFFMKPSTYDVVLGLPFWILIPGNRSW